MSIFIFGLVLSKQHRSCFFTFRNSPLFCLILREGWSICYYVRHVTQLSHSYLKMNKSMRPSRLSWCVFFLNFVLLQEDPKLCHKTSLIALQDVEAAGRQFFVNLCAPTVSRNTFHRRFSNGLFCAKLIKSIKETSKMFCETLVFENCWTLTIDWVSRWLTKIWTCHILLCSALLLKIWRLRSHTPPVRDFLTKNIVTTLPNPLFSWRRSRRLLFFSD